MQTFTCYSCGKDHPYTNESEIKTIIDNDETHKVCVECVEGDQIEPKYLACIWCGGEIPRVKPYAMYCSDKCKKLKL